MREFWDSFPIALQDALTALGLLLPGLAWLLLVRFLDRIGKGVRSAPRDALIAEVVEESHDLLLDVASDLDEDAQAALEIIREMKASETQTDSPWKCSHCGETVDAEYSVCWNCESPRTD